MRRVLSIWQRPTNRMLTGPTRYRSTAPWAFKVESVSGEPIAFVVNNGPQPTFGLVNPSEITSDVAGATERYV
jgi:hypothetical protein